MFREVIEEERTIQRKKSQRFANDLERLEAYKAELRAERIPEWAIPEMVSDWLRWNNIDL